MYYLGGNVTNILVILIAFVNLLLQNMQSSKITALTHVQRVRLLYKTCLRLHRGLPTQMQIVGDAYVKDEFKRHKSANQEQTAAFMEAWAVSPLIVNSSCFF